MPPTAETANPPLAAERRSIRLAALTAGMIGVVFFHVVATEYSVYDPVVSLSFVAILGGLLYGPALLSARFPARLSEGTAFLLCLGLLVAAGAFAPTWLRFVVVAALGATTAVGAWRDATPARSEAETSPARARSTAKKITNHESSFVYPLATILLTYGLLLSNNHAQILYAEAFATEIFAGDTFYHAALAESLVSRGDASSSIHGVAPVKYHYLSHVIYGGLSHLAGTRAFYWYAAYAPLLLISLYVYHGFTFLRGLATYLSLRAFGLPVFCAGLLVACMLPFPLARYGQPLLGESAGLSFVFLLLHAGWLLRFAGSPLSKSRFLALLIGSFLFATLISVTKISTGFVWTAGLGVLALMRLPVRRFFATLPFFLALAAVVLLVVFPEHRLGISSSVAERVRNLFINPGGAFYLFLPAFAALLLIGRRGGWWPLDRLFSAATPRETVGKLLLGVWLAGTLGAAATSNVAPDVLYFTLIPYVLGLWGLGILAFHHFQPKLGNWVRPGRLALVVVPLLLASPYFFYGWGNLAWLSRKEDWARPQVQRLDFVASLRDVERRAPRGAGLYVPPPADYFYHYGENDYPDGALIAVGTTGLPVVSGLLPWQYEQHGKHYGIYYYQRRGVPPVTNETEARGLLPVFGLDTLVVIR